MGIHTTTRVDCRSALAAFGSEAERLASRCAPDTPLILCDGSYVAEAIAEAARRRRAGESYLVMPVLRDNLPLAAREAGRALYDSYKSLDERRYAFEALMNGQLLFNDKLITQVDHYSNEVLQALREFMQFGDGLVARSVLERQRIETTLGRKREYVAIAPIRDHKLVIPPARRGANRIVVWAPEEEAARLAVFSFALWELKQPAIFVCKGIIPDSPHDFISPEQADVALNQAGVIVDTDPSDPGTSLAFAQQGYALAASANSGAQEYIQGLVTYQGHDFLSILSAVSRARAGRRTSFRALPDFAQAVAETLALAQPVSPPITPLVSVVIPTYNRRQELQTNLNHCAKQTYPNVEVIVVNDCGEDVSDIVSRYPFARYLTTPENMGATKAVNFALRAAKGEFIAVVADDDLNYPAQLSTLVGALVASGLDVAHGNILIRLDTVSPDGHTRTYGHTLIHDNSLDTLSVHWGISIHAQGALIRRKTFEEIGFFDQELSYVPDLDSILRLSKCSDFAHVNVLTGEMAYRDNRSNLSNRVGLELAKEVEKILCAHLPPDRPLIHQRIEATVQGVAAAQQGVFFYAWVHLSEHVALPQ